ncbi:MAG: pectinesterase family protein [Tepidisphaeraceae bacterium]
MFGRRVAWATKMAVPELQSAFVFWRPTPGTTQPSTAPTTQPPERHPATIAPTDAPTHQGEKTITVAADGSGDVATVQEAIEKIADNNADRTTIRIKRGKYVGPFVLGRAKRNVSLVGAGSSPSKVVLWTALNVRDPVPAEVPPKMGGNAFIVLGDDFHAENLTFANTAGDHGQAMALRLQADRAVLRDCRLLGWQDTLLVHSGRHYFSNCHIEGRVDFIYGAGVDVFEKCEIDSKQGGYITAASTAEGAPFGYVFLDCKLVSSDPAPTYLGRPWRPFAKVAFIRCEMGAHIRPEGWHNWNKPDAEKTSFYAEYACTGPGADRAQRVSWAHRLSDDEAKSYTVQNVLKGEDGWDPTK